MSFVDYCERHKLELYNQHCKPFVCFTTVSCVCYKYKKQMQQDFDWQHEALSPKYRAYSVHTSLRTTDKGL